MKSYYETKNNISYAFWYADGSWKSVTGSNKSATELKSDAMITLLNDGLSTPMWEKDTININNGYPILK